MAPDGVTFRVKLFSLACLDESKRKKKERKGKKEKRERKRERDKRRIEEERERKKGSQERGSL